MKRLICFILSAALLLTLAGCMKTTEDFENPVIFYYCRSKVTYHTADGVIASELREAGSKAGDYVSLLNLYLKGPEDEDLSRTFPKGTTVVSLEVHEETAELVLGDYFSALTGMELSLACACLTLTVCEMTGAESLTVSTETTLLDGSRSMTLWADQILLEDDCKIPIAPN